ncbi:MAG: guanylate kinase [Rikenellaceae bacterium]|nr:guanylate kinase [Rikenellaceae bacterium]
MGKVLIFSAPSGSGKTTIVKHLLKLFPELEFSISATSRAPRGEEKDGIDYYFMDAAEFMARVEQGEFVEWEEVYKGTCYGTLRAEIDRIWDRGHVVVFDVDVVGALNIKKLFGDQALSVFIMPPSVEALRERLVGRGTDTPEAIKRRLAKAEQEIAYAPKFDRVIINDDLETAYAEAVAVVGDFLAAK